MQKRLTSLLSFLMDCAILGFAGYAVWQYHDYRTHMELYRTYSAPWYTSILLYGALAAAVALACLALKWALRRKGA